MATAVREEIKDAALNLVTYLDMALRARPASETPSEVVKRIEDRADTRLATEGRDSDEESSRRQAVGALLGFVTGLGVGALYGLVRPTVRSWPLPVVSAAAGLAAMAVSDLPALALGVANPASWKPADWLSEVVPHLAYGMATALAFDSLLGPTD